LKIVTAYYPTPAYGGGRIVYIEPVFKLNDYKSYACFSNLICYIS
jgi:hypothetical protein